MSEGFLSRWSRRKQEARQEQLVPVAEATTQAPAALDVQADAGETPIAAAPQIPDKETLPLPTEADLESVQAGGDVVAFMQNKVAPELRNKALKTLFSRPEFNVMDGLDIYIDDYNVFTPLEQSDIDKMALAKQLLSRPDLEPPAEADLGPKEPVVEGSPPVTDDPAAISAEEPTSTSCAETSTSAEPDSGFVEVNKPLQSDFVQADANKPRLE